MSFDASKCVGCQVWMVVLRLYIQSNLLRIPSLVGLTIAASAIMIWRIRLGEIVKSKRGNLANTEGG